MKNKIFIFIASILFMANYSFATSRSRIANDLNAPIQVALPGQPLIELPPLAVEEFNIGNINSGQPSLRIYDTLGNNICSTIISFPDLRFTNHYRFFMPFDYFAFTADRSTAFIVDYSSDRMNLQLGSGSNYTCVINDAAVITLNEYGLYDVRMDIDITHK